jgi:hypothetical protein
MIGFTHTFFYNLSKSQLIIALSLICPLHKSLGHAPFSFPFSIVFSQSQSHISTDGQSVCLSWCRAPSGAHYQILVTVWQLLSCPWEGALSDERTGLSFVSQSAVLGLLSVCIISTFYMCHMLLNTYTVQYILGLLSVRAKYSSSISGSFPITAV